MEVILYENICNLKSNNDKWPYQFLTILLLFENVKFSIAEKFIHEPYISYTCITLHAFYIFFQNHDELNIYFYNHWNFISKRFVFFFTSIVFKLRCSFLIKQFLFLNIIANLYPLFIYFILLTIDLITSLFVYTCTNISIQG